MAAQLRPAVAGERERERERKGGKSWVAYVMRATGSWGVARED